jgi:ribose transport system substrate-binding protein
MTMTLSRRTGAMAALAATIALAAAGCGGDDDGGATAAGGATTSTPATSGPEDQAAQLVADAQEPTAGFEAPGEPFDASKVRGKKIVFIGPLSIPFAQQNAEGLKQAGEAAGATVEAIDGKAQVNDYVRAIEQAISQKADVILIESLPVSLFASQLKKAEAAGIPVISVENHDPGPPPPSDPKAVVASVDQCHACAGRAMAQLAVADSKGKANAVAIWSSDVAGIGTPQVDAIKEEFAKLCPDCKLKVIDAPLAQWATRLGGLTRTTLTANPDVDYILPLYDGMVSFVEPAVRQANAAGRVKVISFNATPSVMKSLKSDGMVIGDVGAGSVRLGWAVADQAFRVLSGVDPVPDPKVPIRLFTASNIEGVDINAAEETWYGDPAEWRDGYKKLWGLTS